MVHNTTTQRTEDKLRFIDGKFEVGSEQYLKALSILRTSAPELAYIAEEAYLKEKVKPYLEAADEFCELNKEYKLSLTGSLMLWVKGYKIRRLPENINLIIPSEPNSMKEKTKIIKAIRVPNGFEPLFSRESDLDYMIFTGSGIRVDIMFSEQPVDYFPVWEYFKSEERKLFFNIPCGSTPVLLYNKFVASLTSLSRITRQTHCKDLEFLARWNMVLKPLLKAYKRDFNISKTQTFLKF